MNSKNASYLSLMGAFLMSAQSNSYNDSESEVKTKKKETKKIIPKGCKEYFFVPSGMFFNTKPSGYNVIFECIASSDKVAEKKFNKWKLKNEDI